MIVGGIRRQPIPHVHLVGIDHVDEQGRVIMNTKQYRMRKISQVPFPILGKLITLDKITDSGPTKSAAEVAACPGSGEGCATTGGSSNAVAWTAAAVGLASACDSGATRSSLCPSRWAPDPDLASTNAPSSA